MREQQNEMRAATPDDPAAGFTRTCSVEPVEAGEVGMAARILAEAFAEDPFLVWAMPRASTRIDDATAFFTFHLRRTRSEGREIFATSDGAAVAVLTTVRTGERKNGARPGELPSVARREVSAADYIRWIETFRPEVDFRYLEFIGILPTCRSKGHGSLLLGSQLARSASEGLPVWCWSSNPRNLPYYHRLGFVAGAELRWNDGTPAVTPLLRPSLPFYPSQTHAVRSAIGPGGN
jgi:GNAT superfamily N-acetyltransferase